MKLRSVVAVFILVCTVFIIGSEPISASMYQSYVYDAWGQAVPTPYPYVPVKVIYGDDLGIGNFRNPQDLFAATDNTLYIVDSGNNRIVRIDSSFTVLDIYREFEYGGMIHTFNNPQGVFVTEQGHMFVADTYNMRIVHFDADGSCINIIGAPETDNPGAFPEYFRFRPSHVAVNSYGRVYVTVEGLYEGLIELDLDGNFRTFLGAPRVRLSPWQYFWYRIASDEQRSRMALLLPTEYSSVHLDDRGFILTTVASSDVAVEQLIRKLNPAGKDILQRDGFHPPMGDIHPGTDSQITGYSILVDIVGRENDIYSVLDRRRGRIFTYDGHGNLLYVFGGLGSGAGLFSNPVALDVVGDHILVLDSRNGSITVFEPTNFALFIHEAIAQYEQGKYEESSELWHQVIRLNANYELAYTGVADAYLRQQDYKTAMHYYKLGNNRIGYSEAFYRYRHQLINDNFGSIMSAIIMVVLLVYVSVRLQFKERIKHKWHQTKAFSVLASDQVQNHRIYSFLKRTWSALKYSRHVIFHPFDGFWDLKHEKRGTGTAATIILVLVILTYIFMRQYTGFILNYNRIEDLNIFLEVVSIGLPFLLWCAVNWALTTLMDGKGTIKDIYTASAYALTPIILINIPTTILSNYITIGEGSFYYLLVTVSIVWAAALLVFGSGVTHDYLMGKTLLTTIAIVIGIGVVFFIGLLFFDVIDRLVRLVQELYTEISFRM